MARNMADQFPEPQRSQILQVCSELEQQLQALENAVKAAVVRVLMTESFFTVHSEGR